MIRRHLWLLGLLVLLCALGVRWRASQAAREVSASGAATAQLPRVADSASGLAPQEERVAEPEAAVRPSPRPGFDPRSDPVLEDRARQHELAAEADARWQRAVDDAGYTASDLDASVRQLFVRIDLEPRYAEGGRIEGLLITGMAPDHPFARLGFQPGDRIDRIQGVSLRDPADLPSLLARLGPNFSLCVDREGAELCGDVHLE